MMTTLFIAAAAVLSVVKITVMVLGLLGKLDERPEKKL